MYRRLAASALAVTLTAAGLVAAGAGPAVAVTNPWSGTVVNHSSGTNDPAPVVLEDSTSKLTTDSVITWSYDMTWTPIAGQATSSDPFNTDMPATATGAISYREEHTTDFEYKPAAGSGDYHCKSVTTVTWSGTATPGNILPTVISVRGAPNPAGGFDSLVTARMSFNDGVVTTTENTGSGSLNVCTVGTTTSTGPWHDTVSVPIHTAEQPPTALQATATVDSQTYLEFAPKTTATVNLGAGPATLRGTTVGGIAIFKPGGSFVTQESARVVDAQGNPVPVASLCIESVWTFTYRPYPMEAPIFNGGPISPGGAGWDVIDRGLDRYGNNVVEVDRGVCNYHQSSLTDRLLLTFTGVTFTSWSYQPRVSATTSFGTYHLDVGPAISGGVPARKALVGAASRPILVP